MGIKNAGAIIKEARLKAGLSQEKLSDGICDIMSLSRIENDNAGVSPATFKKLLERAGADGNAFPVFADRKEFDVFQNMLEIRYYLDCWQLDTAYEKIHEVEMAGYADNLFYCQQCQLYKGELLLKSHMCDYKEVQELLWEAFRMTYPEFELEHFHNYLFSITEIELLIALADCLVYLHKAEEAYVITSQMEEYLSNTQITYQEKLLLKAKNAIAMAKTLIAMKEYEKAYEKAEEARKISVTERNYPLLHELTFLTGVCEYYFENSEKAYHLFEMCFYSAYAAGSIYSTFIYEYVKETLLLEWKEDIKGLVLLPLKQYENIAIKNVPEGKGVYGVDMDSVMLYQLGDIIRDVRMEKKISQADLSRGLCNRSMLSKIENSTLYPDKFLAETLLQRLGLYSDAFTMYGNAREAEIYELKREIVNRLSQGKYRGTESILLKLEKLITEKDIINKQFCSMIDAMLKKVEDVKVYEQILAYTISEFDISCIQDYALSYNELTIINNLARMIALENMHRGIHLLDKIYEYHNKRNYCILEKNRTYLVTIYSLVRHLYLSKRYIEAYELRKVILSDMKIYEYFIPGKLDFFNSQVLGELGYIEDATLCGRCACSNNELVEQYETVNILKRCLQRDFEIKL